ALTSAPTARNLPPRPVNVAGRMRPPRQVTVGRKAICAPLPPAVGTFQIGPLASVTKRPDAVGVMLSGVGGVAAPGSVANTVTAADAAVTRSAAASTPRTSNFESRSLISLPSEEFLRRSQDDRRRRDTRTRLPLGSPSRSSE